MAEAKAALPLGFKNADGRGFGYSERLAKQAAKFGLVPITSEAELKKALAVSGKPKAAKKAPAKKATAPKPE